MNHEQPGQARSQGDYPVVPLGKEGTTVLHPRNGRVPVYHLLRKEVGHVVTHHCDTCGREKEVEPFLQKGVTNGFCLRTETDCVSIYLAWNKAGCQGTLREFYSQRKKAHDVDRMEAP